MAVACLGDHAPFQQEETQELGAQLDFSAVVKPQSHRVTTGVFLLSSSRKNCNLFFSGRPHGNKVNLYSESQPSCVCSQGWSYYSKAAGSTAWCSPSPAEDASSLVSSPHPCQNISPLHPSSSCWCLFPFSCSAFSSATNVQEYFYSDSRLLQTAAPAV